MEEQIEAITVKLKQKYQQEGIRDALTQYFLSTDSERIK